MKRRLWVAAALAPLSFAAMAPVVARADTTISGTSSTPVDTATDGNITVTGTLHPSSGPAAITVDSSNTVSVPGGAIRYKGVNDSADILVDTTSGPLTSGITIGGTLENDEDTTGDGTNQGVADGPWANGSNQFGIEITGPNAFIGSITNTGSITVTGENSAGIAIGADVTGSLIQSGTIIVTGGNIGTSDVSYGIDATGSISGNASIAGTIHAVGQNTTGVAFSGDVGGTLDISATISATGYRTTTAPTDPKVLAKYDADQLLQGGPTVVVGGNVGQGIFINEGSSGVGNIAAITAGTLTVYGSAPTLLIGGNHAITIGPTNASIATLGGGPSLVVGGSATAVGDYPDVSATGIQIGGLNPLAVASSGVASGVAFGTVDLNAGIAVEGSVEVSSEAHTQGLGDATGIIIGSGATISGVGNVAALSVDGTLSALARSDALVATGNGSVGTPETSIFGQSVPITVAGITIQPGASVTTIDNTGTISAEVTGILGATNYIAAGGTQGQAVGIYDASGTVTSLTNSGVISAMVVPIAAGQSADPNHSDAVALYLANVAGNVSVVQNAGVGNVSVPSITGAVIFGNVALAAMTPSAIKGSESLDIEAGSIIGDVVFNGAGANSLTINNGAELVTGLSESSLGTLAVNVENGTLVMTTPTSNTIGGAAAPITLSSLHIGASGEVDFAVDPNAVNATAAQFDVNGPATLDNGAKVGVFFSQKLTSTETFTLLTSTNLTAGNITTSLPKLPFLYNGAITTTPTDIDVTISQKTAAELGFNPNQASAYAAIYSQMSTDQAVESAVLNQTTQAALYHIYNQFLPDYAGGVFETMASGQRAIAEAEAEPAMRLQSDGPRGWVQEIGYLSDRSASATANGYSGEGFGIAGGFEEARGRSALGMSLAFVTTGIADGTQVPDASLTAQTVEAGVYWRGGYGGLNITANINGGYVALGSHRLLLEQTSTGSVTLLRDAESQWSGLVASGQLGINYQVAFGRFYLRPEASADYIALYESAHDESEGGPAFDMAIASRTSSEASVQGDLVFGYTFGTAILWRPEMLIGYREIVSGGPAATTARFISGGSSFTLAPDLTDRGGLLARLGLHAGGTFADVSADAGGEFRDGYQTYDARATARFLF